MSSSTANKKKVIKVYLERKAIREAVLEGYTVTGNFQDICRRGEVIDFVIEGTGLTRNNPTVEHINTTLKNLGVKVVWLTGKRIYRGLLKKDTNNP